MIDQATQALVLHHYPVLRELSDGTLDSLMASATFVAVPAGAMMFDENQPCMGFALLLSGSARVVKAAANGRELHLYDVQPAKPASSPAVACSASQPTRRGARWSTQPDPHHASGTGRPSGSLREIISRLLKNFADQGWVRLQREQIEVLDAASLRALAAP
jgi:CRP-like cAMP-binding protein